MKSADTLTTLFRHNLWANLSMLERCAELTSEQLDASTPGAFGTIRDTLQHFVSSEQSFLYRIRTGQPLQRPEDEAPMTIAEMLDAVRASGAGLIEWAPKVRADDTVQVEWDDGTIREVPKAIYLTQVINHATEHRAQIMVIMTQLGLQAPDLDTWSYFEAL
jgi:uncharacterized damage-inducible protein DinB